MFLAMAQLHLLLDLNEVTEAEFGALCDALEGRHACAACTCARAAPLMPVRAASGDLRLMRRAWHMSAGPPVARGRGVPAAPAGNQ